MNYKHSLAALAVASVVSGQALATTTAGSQLVADALIGMVDGGDPSVWINPSVAGWGGIDGELAAGGNNTVAWTGADACGSDATTSWAGLVCNHTTNEITHIELPNALFGTTPATLTSMTEFFTALAPIADTLEVLNVSGAGLSGISATPSILTGDIPTSANTFTNLRILALNEVNSGAGSIPDLSGLSALEFFNVGNGVTAATNGYTSIDGAVGGAALTRFDIEGLSALTGDITPTLDSATSLTSLEANGAPVTGEFSDVEYTALTTLNATGTGLSGPLNLTNGIDTTNISINNTGIVPDADLVADLGTSGSYDANTTLNALSAFTAEENVSEDAIDFTWANGAGAAPSGYTLGYKLAGAAEFTEVTQAASPASIPVDDGTYNVRVAANLGTAQSSFLSAADVTVGAEAAVVDCPAGSTTATAATLADCVAEEEEEETSGGGGGGAALWLVMLPLMGLLRRKRA